MSTSTKTPTVSEAPIFDPFPEPNTMPSGWDLSGFTSDPQPAPVTPIDDTTEA